MPPPLRELRLKQKQKAMKAAAPDMPGHRYAPPYTTLFRLGAGDFPETYDKVAAELKGGDTDAAARQLLAMVQDESFYEYTAENDVSDDGDPRSWTRLHALNVLQRLGEPARIGIEPLLSLFDDDDDYLQDAIPYYYAAMGEPALEPLAKALMKVDEDAYYRAGAGAALAELGEKFPQLRDRAVAILEQALVLEQEDKLSAAFFVTNLVDLGARESLAIIEQAFAENRIDLSVVQMREVEEHFELPVVTPYIDWRKLPEFAVEEDDEEYEDWSEEEALEASDDGPPRVVQQPFVAPIKAGRNDPCPCGSGKKFKKCHGA